MHLRFLTRTPLNVTLSAALSTAHTQAAQPNSLTPLCAAHPRRAHKHISKRTWLAYAPNPGVADSRWMISGSELDITDSGACTSPSTGFSGASPPPARLAT
eukprot:3940001-Rhodomonas_salina.3